MKKIIAANWKMNPSSRSEAVRLAKASDEKGVIIFPPFVFLSAISKIIKKADLGAQDVFWENPPDGGAFTGEISANMIKRSGGSWVIIGHSERRRYLEESDEIINKKIKASLASGLKVILCIGESLTVKKEGTDFAKNFIKSQLKKNLLGLENFNLKDSNLVIAYEPIWAIGTGKPDDPADAADMAGFIKSYLSANIPALKPVVLYGGSVTSSNTARIFEHKEIDGALVGGASLKTGEFKKIIRIAS